MKHLFRKNAALKKVSNINTIQYSTKPLIAENEQEQPLEVFYKKEVLKNFVKFIAKHLCQSLFFTKVAGLRAATLLKKRLWHRCFPVNSAKFVRTPFLQNTSGQTLLNETTFHKSLYFLTGKR